MGLSEQVVVLDVDRVRQGILVHFSNGKSILYHANFLWDVRDQDGNIPVPYDAPGE